MLDPRQTAFREAYLNPESETYSNATQSAIGAGYDKDYAEHILSVGNEWVSGIIRELQMTVEAENVLQKTLRMVDHEDTGRVKIAQDSAKFIAGTIGKFAEKKQVDITSKGEKLETMTPAMLKIITDAEDKLKKDLLS